MAVVWTNETVLTLIELYQNHPLIWDTSHTDYKNKIKKNDAWESIASTLNIPRKEVEVKMHNIRSQFLKEKKKIASTKTTGSGRADVKISNWFAYDSLLFLLKGSTTSGGMDTMNKRTDEGFSADKEMPPPPQTPTPPPPQTPTPPPPPQTPTPPPPPQTTTPSPLPSSSRNSKKKKNDDLSEMCAIVRSAKRKMDQPKDEFDIYAEYVASELRNVNNVHGVLHAKYLINNILIEARMGKYNYTGYTTRSFSDHPQNYGYTITSEPVMVPNSEHSPVNDSVPVTDSSPVIHNVSEQTSTETTQFASIQELVTNSIRKPRISNFVF